MQCTSCKRDIEIHAKDLCSACYQRYRKTGTTEYQRKGKISICQILGCENSVTSRGLCDKHRKRFDKHGHTDQTRPDSWGAKMKHPLYNSWQWMRRHRGVQEVAPEWQDFLQFVMDVGDRPSNKHKIFPIRESDPLGPNNFTWQRSLTEKRAGETQAEYNARAQKIYRKVRKEEFHGYILKKRFGISRKDYESMLGAQDGVCAICGNPEVVKIRGELLGLAVDHCHATGKIRGLLCSSCNTAIGLMKDDVNLLNSAIKYLSAQS